MAIHDTDRNSINRGSPEPVRHDMLDPSSLMAKGTNSVNYATGASSLDSIVAGQNGQFTIVKSGDWDGTDAEGNLVVVDTTDPGAGDFAADAFTLITFRHALGYVPTVTGFFSINGVYIPLPYTFYFASGGTEALWSTTSLQVDDTNLYIILRTMSYGTTWELGAQPIKWFLMQQTSTAS